MSRTVSIGSAIDTACVDYGDYVRRVAASDLRMYSEEAAHAAVELIDAAKEAGESLGGVVEVVARGVAPGAWELCPLRP